MYTPISNIVVTATMRWPGAAFSIMTLLGMISDSRVGSVVAWIASVCLATYLIIKFFGSRLYAINHKGVPKINWIVEHDQTQHQKPWHLYFIYGEDYETRVHYASYASEEAALSKRRLLEKDY